MSEQEMFYATRNAVTKNHAVGSMVGYYDEALTILSVSDYLLKNLDYSFEEFQEYTKGSLKNLFYGEHMFCSDTECFRRFHGMHEAQFMTCDDTPITVRLYKDESVDSKGQPLWVLSVNINWEREDLALVNKAIRSGSWYMDCDKKGNIVSVSWSQDFRTMLGYHDVSDFPNTLEAWARLLHPSDHDKILSQLYQAICDKTDRLKYNTDYRLRMTDGSYQWYRAVAEIKRRRDGSARRIAGIFVNVEKEKKTLMQVQRSNAFHRAFTKANLCEYYVDLWNNSFESLKTETSVFKEFENDHTWDGLVQMFTQCYVCEGYREAVKRFFDRKTIMERLYESEEELSMECRIMLNGKKRWVRSVVMPGESEDSQYAIIFLRDITNAKKKEAKHRRMKESNAAMEHLIHSMVRVVDHFAICDLKDDTYEYHNINLASKYSQNGAYSTFIRAVADRFKTLEPLEAMEVCLSPEHLRSKLHHESDIYKFEYCSKEEDIFRIASFVPLKWKNGVLTKVLWISIDISEEKKIEIASRRALNDAFADAERANKAKTEFLSNMSHDIRTPMNAIVGLTALAGANIDDTERVLRCLSQITKSSRHLLGLLNEVLDMARIESGRISLTNEEFDMSELVDNLIVMINPEIKEHRHYFEVNIDHIEHEAVCGDSLRIQQMFMNLMSNAIKYTPDGGTIKLSIREKPNGFSELGCFECCIEDNGIGMTPEFQEIMFQPFSRADDHRTTKVQGTGLGLAITRNIVHLMNGDIRVQSAPGKGTKITVTIYLELQNKQEDDIKELIDLPVLVVDDDPVCCESTVATLSDIGIIGEWVTSGQEAIQRTLERHEQKKDYFAVIMDWKMPGMDGVETTRQIRKRIGNDVTIIVLTAYDYADIEDEAKAAGVDAFIAKPLFRSRLTATLKQLATGKPEKSAKHYLMNIAKADYSGKRILVVEDNDLNRELAAEIIGMSKITVETAENGKEAAEKIAYAPAGKYDLVLMDIQMPVMNGYEATAAIRSLPDERSQVPIVAMTANAFAEDVQMAKNTGMNGHIAKPLDFDKLNDIMRKWLA